MKRNLIKITVISLLAAVLASSLVMFAQALRPRHDPSALSLKVGTAFSENELTLFMEKNAKGWTQVIHRDGYTEITSSHYPSKGTEFDLVSVKLTQTEQIAEILYTKTSANSNDTDEFYSELLSKLIQANGRPSESDPLSAFWQDNGIFLTKIPAGVSLKEYSPELLIQIERDAGKKADKS